VPDDLMLSLPAVATSARQMRNAAAELAAAAGMPAAMVDDVKLAVSEAVTNSVRHGSAAGAEVQMQAIVKPGRLEITIADQGPGHAHARDQGLGLGLPIMTAVATDLHVAQAETGTTVTMTFAWP
jgi:serine/threonine-protein kinase RsbW